MMVPMAFVHTRLERVAPFLTAQQRRDFAVQNLLAKNLVVESLTELPTADQKIITDALRISDSKLLELVQAWQQARESEQISLTELIAATPTTPVEPSGISPEGQNTQKQSSKALRGIGTIENGIGWDELRSI